MSTSQVSVEPQTGEASKPSLRRRLAASQSWKARFLRWAYYAIHNFSVPSPKACRASALVALFTGARYLFFYPARFHL
jgi:hypothetical protein